MSPNNNQLRYSSTEKKELQLMLSKRAGPEFISKRAGQGSTKHNYIQGWHYFELLNGVFGFNGWSSSILDHGIDDIEVIGTDENPKYNVATFATVRLTLKDGTCREDLGVGEASNAKSKAAGLKQARKEAVTDAIKRCFRQFGSIANYLGDDNFNKILQQAKNIPQNKIDSNDFVHMADLRQFRSNVNNKIDAELQADESKEPKLPTHVEVNLSNLKLPMVQQDNQIPRSNTAANDMGSEWSIDMDNIDPADLDRARRISRNDQENDSFSKTPKKSNFTKNVLEVISPENSRRKKK
eukprot:NODE_322_length_11016_cov_0.249061.p3 type:complete len:296 gc:universal NODE_322_length_11016_cov_0.249061:3264-4151(+)